MTDEKTTDATLVGVWMEPTLLKAVDEARGKESRQRLILKLVAKGLGIKKYKPRGKGRPAKADLQN